MKSFNIALLALQSLSSSYGFEQQQIPLAAAPPTSIPIPLLGYGTWNLKPNASDGVSCALQTGYRHIDGAAIYGNEKEVGKGIKDGLKKAGLERSDIWVTSKLWNNRHRPDQVPKALEQTLSDLDLDYLDLYLMHWPVATSSVTGKAKLDYIDTWHAMEALLATGKVRHIGVSNFDPIQLNRLIASSTIKPAAHQFEMHPYLQQPEWLEWHQAHGIHVTAYSPLANLNPTYDDPSAGDDRPPSLLENSAFKDIAEKRGCSGPAAVALAWGMGRGSSVIPKSAHAERIEENFGALECELEFEDLKVIAQQGRQYLTRFSNPSGNWGVELYEGLDGT